MKEPKTILERIDARWDRSDGPYRRIPHMSRARARGARAARARAYFLKTIKVRKGATK